MSDAEDPWINSIVESGTVDPTTLTPNPLNWRMHPQYQIDALEGLLNSVGWVNRILVNKRTGNMVDGHARVETAIAQGEQSVPVDYIDVSEDAEQLILATFDPLSSMAYADAAMLADLIEACADNLNDLLKRGLERMPGAQVDGEWDGMPGFEQEDLGAFQTLDIHFDDQAALERFLEQTGLVITERTRYVWYPEAEIDKVADLEWQSEKSF